MTAAADRVALVTGCGKPDGMGQAIARRLAGQGVAVVVTDLQATGVPNRQQEGRSAGWGGGSCPPRLWPAASTNSRRGFCSWPREMTSRWNTEASTQSAMTRTLRLKVGTRLTW